MKSARELRRVQLSHLTAMLKAIPAPRTEKEAACLRAIEHISPEDLSTLTQVKVAMAALQNQFCRVPDLRCSAFIEKLRLEFEIRKLSPQVRREVKKPPNTADPDKYITAFWKNVDKTESCWLWTGTKDLHGYPCFWNGKRQVKATKFSYDLKFGPGSSKRYLHHTCGNRACVNPGHLV